MGPAPATGSRPAPAWALRFGLGLVLAIWAGILLERLQALQPLHLQVIGQLLPLSRFGAFHASWFFSQIWCELTNLTWCLGFFAAAFGLGSALLERFFPETRPRLETMVFSLALGFAALAFLIFLIGVLHGLHTWLFMPVFTFLAVWGGMRAWQRRQELFPRAGWWLGSKPDLAEWGLNAALLAVLGAALLNASLPELFFDALVYHLGVPAQWIVRGAIVPLPTVFFSNLPMGVEMLYTGALLLSQEVLCRYLHVSLGVLAVLAVFAMGRRWFGRRAGFWAAGIFATIPLFIMNAVVAGVDAGSTFFAVAALLALLNAALGTAQPGRGFWLAGLLTGAALSCKYNTAFMLVPAGLFSLAAFYLRHRDLKKMTLVGAQICVGAFLVLSPWLIKNLIFTGNPVFPFAYQVIPSRNVQPEKMKEQMDGFREFGQRTPGQILRLPWDLTFYYPTSNSYVGAVFLFLLPGFVGLGLRAKRAPPVQKILLATAAAAALIWGTQTQITRYFLPGFPILAVLSGALLMAWARWSPVAGKVARWSVLALLLYSLVFVFIIGLLNWDPLGVDLGHQPPERYLDQKLMTSYLPIARRVNSIRRLTKVYVFGETRAYYFEKPVTTVTVYDANPLLQWLDAGPTPEAVWQHLRAGGYTHLSVHEQEAVRTRGYEPYLWTPQAVFRWQVLQAQYLRRVTISGQDALYAVLEQPDLTRPVKEGRPLFSYSPEVTAKVAEHVQAGINAEQQLHYLDAEAEWQRIIALAPAWNVPYQMLGWQYRQQKRWDAAWVMYRRAESLTDLDAATYNDLGAMAWSLGQLAEARRCLHNALVQEPHFEIARRNLEALEQAMEKQAPASGRPQ